MGTSYDNLDSEFGCAPERSPGTKPSTNLHEVSVSITLADVQKKEDSIPDFMHCPHLYYCSIHLPVSFPRQLA